MRSPFKPFLTACAVLFAMFLHTTVNALEIVAHRGASHDAPENTLAAFALGWEQQADAGELDIHLTRDRRIVVIHDPDTKRTAGASGTVASQTLKELRTLDAGSWKGARWRGQKIPTLSEALETVPEGNRMFIEIKCGPEVLPVLEDVLRNSGKKPEQLALIGFSHTTMAKAKQRFPGLAVHWIVGHEDKKTKQPPELATLIEKAKAARLDGLHLDFRLPINADFVAKVRQSGLQLYVWTVDDAAVAGRLKAAGVHGITTNRPGWLRQQLK